MKAITVLIVAALAVGLACSKSTEPEPTLSDSQYQINAEIDSLLAYFGSSLDNLDSIVVVTVLGIEDTNFAGYYNGWWVSGYEVPGFTQYDSLQFTNDTLVIQYPCIEGADRMHFIHHLSVDFGVFEASNWTGTYDSDVDFIVDNMQQYPGDSLFIDGTGQYEWDATYTFGQQSHTFGYTGAYTYDNVAYAYTYDSTYCEHTIDPEYPVGGSVLFDLQVSANLHWEVTVVFPGTVWAQVTVVLNDGATWTYEYNMLTGETRNI
jgi:hypothetical protein